MVPANDTIYHNALLQIMNGAMDLDTDDIRVALVLTGHSSNRDDDLFSGFSALGECTVANYSRQALASEAVNIDEAGNRALFDAADSVFSSLTTGETITGVLVHKHHATPGSEVPIVLFVLGTAIPTNGGDVTIQWNASGIMAITGVGD